MSEFHHQIAVFQLAQKLARDKNWLRNLLDGDKCQRPQPLVEGSTQYLLQPPQAKEEET